jgi:hypothetical protein
MSRHTRWLRKQAKAKAAEQQRNNGFSGGTAVLDRPGTNGHSLDEDFELGSPEPDEGWTETDFEEPAVATDVQAREGSGPVAEPVDTTPVLTQAKASLPGSPPPARRVIPGREPVVETPPGQQRPRPNDGWFWRDKIRVGDMVVLVGEEGSGKTRVLTDWIARLTAGRAFPGTEDASHALPPSDVLVFNCVDDFQHNVRDQVALNGGDPDRVLQATTQLLDWGHSHSEFPEGPLPAPGLATGELPEFRVRLHTQEILKKLGQFLQRRPSIRLVVIDQLKQHLKTDSERVFEDLIFDLQVLGRQTEVTFVLTQRPDAFRNGTGLKQYFKSASLTSVARSVWRVAQPEDPAHGDRVLECLKLNHGFGDSGREPWRLWQAEGEPLRWEQGDGQEFALSKLDAKQRLLFHAKTFISLYLQMFGGLADFHTLQYWGRKEGITGSKLMEASIVYNFGFEFEGSPDSESGMRKVIGSQQAIRQRQAIPEPERPAVLGPPIPKQRKKPSPLAPQRIAVTRAATPAPAGQIDGGDNASGPTATAAMAGVPAPAQAVMNRPSSPAGPRPSPTPAQMLASLRARVARGEARLQQFDREGFRFIKPNLATCHLLLNLQAELGSEEALLAHLRRGLVELGQHSADDLAAHLEEYRRLFQIAQQVEGEHDATSAA